MSQEAPKMMGAVPGRAEGTASFVKAFARRLTPVADTDKREQQRPMPDPRGRSAEDQARSVDVDGSP
ncbi:hypothetical protein ACFRDV_29495 [Streptomyces fagopyri]|uniref:hypothetical protein n=1 Tax=Streptomyces fagopyri TaxID=2662397 RepID=UPI0036A94DC3